jgi:hypothetical protein
LRSDTHQYKKLAKIPDKFPLRYTSAYKILTMLQYA